MNNAQESFDKKLRNVFEILREAQEKVKIAQEMLVGLRNSAGYTGPHGTANNEAINMLHWASRVCGQAEELLHITVRMTDDGGTCVLEQEKHPSRRVLLPTHSD